MSFILDILDKVCMAYLAFFIYRQLPERMVHFFLLINDD